MSYNNLTKLANAMDQQSEQEKKPSKATYIPALAGLTAGGALAHQGEKSAIELAERLNRLKFDLAYTQAKQNFNQEMLKSLPEQLERLAGDIGTDHPEYMDKAKILMRKEIEEGNLKRNLKAAAGDLGEQIGSIGNLEDIMTTRNRKALGGLGLLGLGIGTTALLRNRKKRKQGEG